MSKSSSEEALDALMKQVRSLQAEGKLPSAATAEQKADWARGQLLVDDCCLNESERAAEKQRSRDEDARALASGEKTREQLRLENSHFREIAHEPIQWDKTKLV